VSAPVNISPFGVGASAAFVACALVVASAERAGETRQILVASVRAGVQLVAIGYVINWLFRSHSLLLTAAMVAVMIVTATQIAARRGAGIPGAWKVAAIAITLGSCGVLASLVAMGVFDAHPQTLLPVAGMLVGNCMASTGIALREVARERSRGRAQIEAALALGASNAAACAPARSRTFRAAIGPLIDQTKAVGLVALPGAMTGMILAGVSPLKAVRLQIVVMYMLLGATTISVFIATRLATRRLFDERDRLLAGPAAD
jgi:putative ABC transport system permease protein